MDKTLNRKQNLLLHLIYFIFIFSLAYLLSSVLDLEYNVFIQILIILIIGFIIKFFLLNPLILGILLILSLITGVLINHYIISFIFPLMDKIYDLTFNIINNILGKENIVDENVVLFWIILVAIISFANSLVIFKNKKIYPLAIIYLIAFLSYWYNFYDLAYWMLSLFILFFIILIGLRKYLKIEPQIKDSPKHNFNISYNLWMKTLFTYSLLIVFIALIMPKTHIYIKWPWLQQQTFSVFPFVQDLRSHNPFSRGTGKANSFDFSTTDYQVDPSRLGGPVNLSNRKIMTLYSKNPHYLRGNIKQLYTGSSWESVKGNISNYSFKEDFSQISKEETELYYDTISLTITNHDFASTTIFSPYKPSKVNSNKEGHIIVQRDDSITLPQGVYSQESYAIQAKKPLPYGKLVALGLDRKKEDIEELDLYLQIPNNHISQRTIDLTENLIKDLENDFQKALAIENYLRTNYEYSLDVNWVPKDKEFVDYFLFAEKRGYCTYYATSMAIMLRIAGIPSRYIEGYLASESIGENIYEIRTDHGHAWVEAFIEPVGWITWEPTPIYTVESRMEDYEPREDFNNEDLDNSGEINIPVEEDIFSGDLEDYMDIGGGPWYPYEEEDVPEILDINYRKISLYIIFILLLIPPLQLIIGVLKFQYKKFKTQRLSSNEKVLIIYQDILNLMSILGFPQEYGETHYEYARRISYKFYSPKEMNIVEVTEIFMRNKYGNIPITSKDMLALEEYKKDLDKRIKYYLGRSKYYYYKFILSIIF